MEPFSLSPNYYDAVYMIKRSNRRYRCNRDPAKLAEERILIRDYCNDISNFEGLQFNWNNKGGYPADKPLFLFEIQGGQKVLVDKIIPNRDYIIHVI